MERSGLRAGLRADRVAALSAAVLIPLVMFVAASWTAYLTAFRELHQRTDETTALLVEHTNRTFEAAEQAMRRAADRVRTRPVAELAADPTVHAALRAIVNQVDSVASVWIVDLQGEDLASSEVFPARRTGPRDREFIRVPAEGDPERPFVSAPFVGATTGRPHFALSMKALGPDGRPAAIVVASIAPGSQAAFFDRILPQADRVIGLTRADGHLLARSPDLGARLVRLEPTTGLLSAIARPGGAEAGSFTSVAQVNGIERYYAYQRIANHPVYLSVGLATAEAWATWRRSTAGFGAVTAVGILLLVLVVRRLADAAAAEAKAASDLITAQSRMFQAQKLEALGKLTSGVAHDFNNLLMAISGSVALLRSRVTPAGAPHVDTIGMAVDRGERLAKQLLGFTRTRTAALSAIDLNARLAEARPLVEKLVGTDVTLRFEASGGALPVVADPEGFELSLLNMVANARDAMPTGGTVRIVTGRDDAAGLAFVDVRDTGVGMSEAVRARCLEPFFTTKDIGQGTGLGLSAVHGFVQRAGGRIQIDSAPGAGTTVRLVLPLAAGGAEERRELPAAVASPVAAGTSRVLVVEDDPLVAHTTIAFLREAGLTVDLAGTAGTALAMVEAAEAGTGYDVVVTDVGLPGGMSGVELARAVHARLPAVRLVVVTGYGAGTGDLRALPAGVRVLEKPFVFEDLLDAVVQVADGVR